ncbi:TetR/AcrR family transcriptional regulator [Variovorax sp. J31P179]|uniref:TetR/AcrR family transcriptional regulator n=1 Tax=Variovorax sp. J31P179 TaxID=3053508 RepID=UPI002576488E|nr:TetR/AcrR family transcriptional regulator [Variovorax sp. J31P179]MDM0084736.1 TetR/AcrR family transcriptional regulator [Variovorax sp. J31P179]
MKPALSNEPKRTVDPRGASQLQAEIREFKREKVLDAALRLFYEKGYSNTTMDEVARSLGVTKPFVYRYFPSKEALLVALYEQSTDVVIGLLAAATEKSTEPDEQLAMFIDSFVRENTRSVMVGMVYMQEEKHLDSTVRASVNAQQKRFDTGLAALIEKGVERGMFVSRDPRVAALAITGMVRWLQRWYKKDGRLSEDQISSIYTEMALNSLCYQKPAARSDATKKRAS